MTQSRELTQGYLNIRKLKGHDTLYRVRVGRVCIIYRDEGDITIEYVGMRNEKTYRGF